MPEPDPDPVTIRGRAFPSISVGTAKERLVPITYGGVKYPAIAACARAHGISTKTFALRLKEGRDPVTGKRPQHAQGD